MSRQWQRTLPRYFNGIFSDLIEVLLLSLYCLAAKPCNCLNESLSKALTGILVYLKATVVIRWLPQVSIVPLFSFTSKKISSFTQRRQKFPFLSQIMATLNTIPFSTMRKLLWQSKVAGTPLAIPSPTLDIAVGALEKVHVTLPQGLRCFQAALPLLSPQPSSPVYISVISKFSDPGLLTAVRCEVRFLRCQEH